MRGLDGASPAVLATVIESAAEPAVGAHALFIDRQVDSIRWSDQELLERVRSDAADAFQESRRGLVRAYGSVTIAFEVVTPSIQLLVCGSGPDVVPLARLAGELDWNLTIVDHRHVDSSQAERFPAARVIECVDPSSLSQSFRLSSRTAAVVMSHNYARDLDYVRALLASDVAYIGVLGPRARTERMLADLAGSGEKVERGDRIYSPVGIDTGGDGPDSIALSIIAEVSTVLNSRSGGHLRDSGAPLHSSPAGEVATKT